MGARQIRAVPKTENPLAACADRRLGNGGKREEESQNPIFGRTREDRSMRTVVSPFVRAAGEIS